MNPNFYCDADEKNIGLAKSLIHLRQALDVYRLTCANRVAIRKVGLANNFFHFLAESCVLLITLDLCKIYEYETRGKQGKVLYELNSIEGVLQSLAARKPAVPDTQRIDDFVRKYNDQTAGDGTLEALRGTVTNVRTKYCKELKRFKAFRDKWVAHGEFKSRSADLPSYDLMERLFDFGKDFYVLVSEAFFSVGPHDVNRDTGVRADLTRLLEGIGIEGVKTEMRDS